MIDTNLQPIIVFFDLETGSFSKSSDVLQIAAKFEKYEFSVYIKPTQNISDEASAIHGLRVIDGSLRLHEAKVITLSRLEAIVALYQFLTSFGRKCILTAHNCSFDYPRLINVIETVFMIDHFQIVVEGFCDSLPIIRNVTKKKEKERIS